MGSSRAIADIAVVLVLATAGPALAGFPDQWTRDPANPIATDLGGIVLFHEGMYKMWGNIGDVTGGFSYATSLDGRVWNKHAASPVLLPGPAWYDSVQIANAAVVVADSVYHMWYSGIAADGDNRIAHATSTDGVFWAKDSLNNPVMDLGPPGSLDANEVIHPFVLYEEPLFRMWYNGVGGAPSQQRILYAESSDGVAWTRFPTPALDQGSSGDWDDDFLGMMSVLPFAGSYHMYYTGADSGGTFQIGYATSPDGISWTKRMPSEPVLGPGTPSAWDDLAVLRPVVLSTDTGFKMWYGGTQDFVQFSWGLATALDPTAVLETLPATPLLQLGQNAPNPSSANTVIRFSLAVSARVVLRIYDVTGHEVRELIGDRTISAGLHQVVWDGRNQSGSDAAAGVYFYRLTAGERSGTRKMVLVR